jgi:hypothetical protein
MKKVDKVWDVFWKDIVCNKDGSINIKQVKKELYDFHFVMQEVPKVYSHITNGRLSKILYPAETVITEVDDIINQEYIMKDDLRDLLK